MTARFPSGAGRSSARARCLPAAAPLRPGVAAWALLGLAAIAALIAACAPAASATASPDGAASGSQTPGPKPTNWPTTVVEATVALGAANGDFAKMSDDLSAAVNSEDAAVILTAVNDALTFLKGNQTNTPKLQAYDATKSVGDRLASAYAKMIDGLTKVRDGINSADAAAVDRGFQAFTEGSHEYIGVAPDLGTAAEQAILMKRLLLK
jgi:hypothetical protein